MEGLLFIIILVVASLLRGAGKQQRRQPPQRPRQPLPEGRAKEEKDGLPAGGPVRGRIFTDEEIFLFPARRTEPPKPSPPREKPVRESKPAPIRPKTLEVAPPVERGTGGRSFFKGSDELSRGIILAEVLGPPLSKRKKRGFV